MSMRGGRSWGMGSAPSIPRMAILLVVALAVGLIALPSRALAAGEALLDIRQSFSTTGSVPESVDGSFAYELTRTDGVAPLPTGSVGDTYSFTLSGSTTTSFGLLVGSEASADALTFSKVGVYSYELRCVTDASSVSGLSVDGSVYTVRVSVERDGASGLQIGWIEVRDESGEKSNEISFAHTYAGSEATTESERKGGILPQTGVWGLMQLSAILCVVGIVTLVMGAVVRRRNRAGKGR